MTDVPGYAVIGDASAVATPGAMAALAVLLGASALAARRLRSPGRSGLAWFAAFGSVALVIAVTLLRDGWPSGIDLGGLGEWSGNGWDRLSGDPVGSSEILLNVALFVPVGAAWTWLLGRPWIVLATLATGSLAVETAQSVTGAGAADVADLAANTVGAAIGVGAAMLIRRVRRRPRASRVAWWKVVAAGGAAVVVVGAGLLLGAENRQRSVEDELRERFAGTSKAEVDAMLADMTGNGPEELFSAISARSDGVRTTPDATELRYPATFFSLHRCVFVTWTADGVTFRRAAGKACSTLLG